MRASGSPCNSPRGPRRSDDATGDKSDEQPPADHLLPGYGEDSTGGRDEMAPTKPREWVCDECRRRVTRSARAPVEYGHSAHCSHSITRSDVDAVGVTEAGP
jgi:hypothetical protein